MPMCSTRTAIISSAVMQSGMSVHDIAFMIMHIPRSSSLITSGFCLDSQSTINSCGLGLYSILMLY